jgi:hypothetical protein
MTSCPLSCSKGTCERMGLSTANNPNHLPHLSLLRPFLRLLIMSTMSTEAKQLEKMIDKEAKADEKVRPAPVVPLVLGLTISRTEPPAPHQGPQVRRQGERQGREGCRQGAAPRRQGDQQGAQDRERAREGGPQAQGRAERHLRRRARGRGSQAPGSRARDGARAQAPDCRRRPAQEERA